MSSFSSEEHNTAVVIDETRSMNEQELADVKKTSNRQNTPFASEEVGRHISALTDPLFKQLEYLYDLMSGLQENLLMDKHRKNGFIQNSARAANHRYESLIEVA